MLPEANKWITFTYISDDQSIIIVNRFDWLSFSISTSLCPSKTS